MTALGMNKPAQDHGLVPSRLVYNRLAQLGNISGRTEEKREIPKK
jgi:hypothetical protein